MASSLYKEGRMKTEYIDFLINKHLNVLHFDWLKDSSWDVIVAKFKEVGPDLRNVYFSYYVKPLQDLMPYLPNLEVMTFHRCCTNEVLKGLAEFCDNILKIDIFASNSVTNEGVKQLCFKGNGEKSCVKLRKLQIRRSSVTEEGVVYIMKHLPSIEIIGFHILPEVLYSMHKNDLPLISNIKPYNLLHLNLGHYSLKPHFTDLLKICLSVCPCLKSLFCCTQKQEHLKIISEFPALQHLVIGSVSNSEIQINDMLELNGKKLHSLSLLGLPLSVRGLSNSCPVLKHLSLFEVGFKDDSLSSCVFPCLETCIFHSMKCNGEYCASIGLLLRSSPKLEYIAFKNFILSNDIKLEILKCYEQKPIKKIILGGSAVEINFVRDILRDCRSLKNMTLDHCGLNSEEKMELSKIAQSLTNNPELHVSNDGNNRNFEDNYEFFNWLDQGRLLI